MKKDKINKPPCFVLCNCKFTIPHGSIVLADGRRFNRICSIEAGEKVIKDLLNSKKISQDDADRIGDTLIISSLVATENDFKDIIMLAKDLEKIFTSTIEAINNLDLKIKCKNPSLN